MARPMILINEKLLVELYDKYVAGVKYETLIRKCDLPITGPTLKKRLNFYEHMLATQRNAPEISEKIRRSIFPQWLVDDVEVQDSSMWQYEGVMPLGEWISNEKG
jgi:hypothetical protein